MTPTTAPVIQNGPAPSIPTSWSDRMRQNDTVHQATRALKPGQWFIVPGSLEMPTHNRRALIGSIRKRAESGGYDAGLRVGFVPGTGLVVQREGGTAPPRKAPPKPPPSINASDRVRAAVGVEPSPASIVRPGRATKLATTSGPVTSPSF